MKPLFYAKSALREEQLIVKKRLGCDGIEVQLLGELIVDSKQGVYRYPREAFDLNYLSKYPVHVVHAPLIPGKDDVPVEVLCDNKDMDLLHHIFYIANSFGNLQKRKVIVVLHSESYYGRLVELGDAWSRMCLTLSTLLNYYPYTEVAIENMSPTRGIGKGRELHLSNNFAFDNVEMVRILREELKTDRIGTCLDTCHAMISQKYITHLYDFVEEVPAPNLSMRNYFERNYPYLKLVHLCDMRGSGQGRGRHGIPFHAGTYHKMSSILDLYHEYQCTCPITLEVEESDFFICDGYRNTKEQVERYYAEHEVD